jgi:hypothetical protein
MDTSETYLSAEDSSLMHYYYFDIATIHSIFCIYILKYLLKLIHNTYYSKHSQMEKKKLGAAFITT